ncbi:tetratricopeptide repeat protein [Patescibacteria group bacterium]|nr:tetratricopeptide repeat protein [Patescibacteria group bacterium]
MIYNYIAIGVIIASMGIIIYIISRKFPVISSINTDTLQKHRQNKVKKEIIEHRLKRKLTAFKLTSLFKKDHEGEAQDKGSLLGNLYKSLKGLEKKYQSKIKAIEPQEEDTVAKNKSLVLKEAESLIAEDKLKEAEDKFIEAVSLDNKFIAAYEGLAELYQKMKDPEHAKEIYQYLIKIHVTNDREAPTPGSDRMNSNEPAQSVSLNSQVAGYHFELGEVYLALDEADSALASLKEAVKLEPNNPRILDALVALGISLKDKALAKKYYDQLKEANPENDKLKELQKEIRNLK